MLAHGPWEQGSSETLSSCDSDCIGLLLNEPEEDEEWEDAVGKYKCN